MKTEYAIKYKDNLYVDMSGLPRAVTMPVANLATAKAAQQYTHYPWCDRDVKIVTRQVTEWEEYVD